MSSTNLTDGKSKVCFFMMNCERNYLKSEEKAGEASKVKKEDAKNLSINLGVSDMVIPQKTISINKEGRRSDNSQRQDMEKMDYKVERMKKINAERLKETKRKDSNTEHDDR